MGRPAPRRKRGARFQEIARQAGVSVATVDRVLNERDTVADATRRRVIEAARALAVPRLLPDPDHALRHIDLLLPRNDTPFFQQLGQAFRESIALLDRRVIVHRRLMAEADVRAMAAAIASPPGYPRSGLIIAAPDTPGIRAAVQAAVARGERIVTVVTELPDQPGLTYCGMNNRRAGQAAGDLMGRMVRGPGRVAVVANSMAYRGHRERADGFAEVIARAPGIIMDLVEAESLDQPDRCYQAIRRAAAAGPLVGIYNTGAGSEGIWRALASLPGPAPIWIGHEISDDHIGHLRAGRMQAVIDQDPRGQAQAALQTLLAGIGHTQGSEGPRRAELRIHTAFSLPEPFA